MCADGYDDSQPIQARRHPEWVEHENTWNRQYDSWEGGDRYRNATYGFDTVYRLPIYNLVRHKHEIPDHYDSATSGFDQVGADAAARSAQGDFEYRRSRTPVPTLVPYAVEAHTSKLYSREVERDGPPELLEWWKNIDGMGATIDEFMEGTLSQLLLVLGCIDFVAGRPVKPKDVNVESIHDQEHFRLTKCIGSYILPQNMLWWRLDTSGMYSECLVMERQDNGAPYYRHWTAIDSTLYDNNGVTIDTMPHDYKCVPIIRLFDRRNPRCRNIGLSRYQGIVELQREFYNRDSELILSDTHQAFPLLQGPEEYCATGMSIPIGPTFLLPMKLHDKGGTATYQGFETIPFDKSGAESIRLNKADILDAVDRDALLTKPAGQAGTSGQTVAQSGVSKRLDQQSGNDRLTKIATRLQAAEIQIAMLALRVLHGGKQPDPESIKVLYSKTYDLNTPDETAALSLIHI